MAVIISRKLSRDKQKYWYHIEWGKVAGQRISSGVFTYAKPKDQLQKNHNKEALTILEFKRSQMVLDHQAISTGYIPHHKKEANFLDYYQHFVDNNQRATNRILPCSLAAFKKFLKKDLISPNDITENLCLRFRQYLLDLYNGEGPANYFTRFKKVLKAAKKDGYFRENPAEDIVAKTNRNKKVKEILNQEEYLGLLKTPCINHEVKKAFIFSLYTGLRWADVKPLRWKQIGEKSVSLIQQKTGIALDIPLHKTALELLGPRSRQDVIVFHLPTADGANKTLLGWAKNAGISKHITWHCARHSFSVLLQDKGTDIATVAGLLGHTSTKHVQQTYKRYNKKNGIAAIDNLPFEQPKLSR